MELDSELSEQELKRHETGCVIRCRLPHRARTAFSVTTQRLPHLVRQLLVELLRYGLVELLVEIPRGDSDGVDHLHQDEHGANCRWATHETRAPRGPEASWPAGSPFAVRGACPLSSAEQQQQQVRLISRQLERPHAAQFQLGGVLPGTRDSFRQRVFYDRS